MVLLFVSAVDSAADWQAELEKLLPEVEFRVWPDLGDPTEIEAALVWRPKPGLLEQLPNLKLILSLGAGVDHILADPALPPGVPIVRLVDPHMTAAMSEYVQLQVLRLHRQDPAYRTQQQARLWQPLPQPSAAERRVGVLGMGVLGSDAALKLKVLGFDVAGWSRAERKLPGVPSFCGADGLAALLRRSEILICLLPLTPATAGLLDAARSWRSCPAARRWSIARAAPIWSTSTCWPRSIVASSPPRCSMSFATSRCRRSTRSGATRASWSRRMSPRRRIPPTAAVAVADNLRRLDEGRPLLNRVDVSVRY